MCKAMRCFVQCYHQLKSTAFKYSVESEEILVKNTR